MEVEGVVHARGSIVLEFADLCMAVGDIGLENESWVLEFVDVRWGEDNTLLTCRHTSTQGIKLITSIK